MPDNPPKIFNVRGAETDGSDATCQIGVAPPIVTDASLKACRVNIQWPAKVFTCTHLLPTALEGVSSSEETVTIEDKHIHLPSEMEISYDVWDAHHDKILFGGDADSSQRLSRLRSRICHAMHNQTKFSYGKYQCLEYSVT